MTNSPCAKKPTRGSFGLELAGIVALVTTFATSDARAASQLMDYFTPTPIVGPLSSTCWGAAQVGPRDQSNGLEDKTLAKWVYWDGGVIKAPDGTYHMFASRWDQSNGHNGWMCCSYGIHATSKNLFGPYTDLGTFYTFDGGKGHNVTPFVISDGLYGVSISGVRPGHVFTATSLDGPWTDKGDVTVDSGSSNFCTQCNLKIMHRPDGRFMAVSSQGLIAVSQNLAGPYGVQGSSVFATATGIPDKSKLEDPSIWYSGGKYHLITNEWDIKKAFHFTSADGLKDWTLEKGYAYDPNAGFVRHTDSTVNHWAKMERPEVYMENGRVAAFTFAAINVEKENDLGNDKNGSKVIVVPFDGVAFDSGGIPGSGQGGVGGGSGGTSGIDGGIGAGGMTSTGSGGNTGVGGNGGNGTGGNSGTGGRAGGSGGAGGAGGSRVNSGGGAFGSGGAGTSSGGYSGGNTGVGGNGGNGAGGNAGTGGRTVGGGGAGGAGGSSVNSGGGVLGNGGAGTSSGGSSGTSSGGNGGSTVASLGGATSHGGATTVNDKKGGCSCALNGGAGRNTEIGIVLLLVVFSFAPWRRRRTAGERTPNHRG